MLSIFLYSNGLNYEIISQSIGIKAEFSDGGLFKNGGVKVYAPDNYLDPKIKETTDEKGIFYFKPDKPGDWVIMLGYDTGHGARINLTIDKNLNVKRGGNPGSFEILQKIIMSVSIIKKG